MKPEIGGILRDTVGLFLKQFFFWKVKKNKTENAQLCQCQQLRPSNSYDFWKESGKHPTTKETYPKYDASRKCLAPTCTKPHNIISGALFPRQEVCWLSTEEGSQELLGVDREGLHQKANLNSMYQLTGYRFYCGKGLSPLFVAHVLVFSALETCIYQSTCCAPPLLRTEASNNFTDGERKVLHCKKKPHPHRVINVTLTLQYASWLRVKISPLCARSGSSDEYKHGFAIP